MGDARVWILVMNSSNAQILRRYPPTGDPGERQIALRASRRRMSALLRAPELAPPEETFVGFGENFAQRTIWRRALDVDHLGFLHQVADFLEAHRVAGDFDGLAVFAGPKTLPRFLALMPVHLRQTVIAEFDQNLIDLPPDLMRSAIAAALRGRIDVLPGRDL
nr:host attachment protein [Acidimangrovimonas sediminis]